MILFSVCVWPVALCESTCFTATQLTMTDGMETKSPGAYPKYCPKMRADYALFPWWLCYICYILSGLSSLRFIIP